MIGRLTGKVLSRTPDRVLLDVTGVGYDVHIPLSTFCSLPGKEGAVVSLHVHTHVREDTLQLFGFGSFEERGLFEMLIGISGVGPRLALAILSGIGVHELRDAVSRQDRARLQKIPGVGRKTAERLLLELRDKLSLAPGTPGAESDARNETGQEAGLRSDATSALVNLGYSREVAERAVEGAWKAEGAAASIETILRAALTGLVR